MIFSSLKTVTKRLSLVVTVLLFTFFTVSCQNPAQGNYGEIIGTWTSSYGEIYTITGSNLKKSGLDYYTQVMTEFFSGDNLLVRFEDGDSGYIYFTYTKAYNSDDVGRWYAVHYKNLTSNSVSLSDAYKEYGESSTETLSEAIIEFTVENGYFSGYSECTK
jgi:hypothetical protein